ncbi:RnfABCDGE type electron transport complex subunit D [Thiococcus pfennigii]|uniref:RnfABCDGE type electron transport complex subunit D n=1 Tax=Thiococcus pfennigii TaxID=1057 RepID=UPI001908FE75|nr:RnfABCDGE type electron transport complex subunit D [Thiococcus pfennigii]MBK1730933.1 electron transporter RnfD [Thiococcus pfennigii]
MSALGDPPLIAGPFAHAPTSIGLTMRLVMLALIPGTLVGLWQFGWPAINLFVVTIATAILAEAAALRLARRPVRPYLLDGSALLSGWLLAMTLPPWAPWWIGAVGGLIAIIVAKQVFGGLGQNLFNPAMIARVALLISFPVQMTTFVAPTPLFSADAPDFLGGLAITFGAQTYDAMTSATVLGQVHTDLGTGLTLLDILPSTYQLNQAAIGTVAGSLGETSALLLLLGGLFLISRRVISWHIPVAMLATITLCATAMHLVNPNHFLNPGYHLLSGATILAAFFIATDPVTAPVSARGRLLFGFGCGLLVYVIRTWSSYPEGAAFAVLLMNACTPLIDHYVRPRIYGRDRRGEPLAYGEDNQGTTR